MKKDGLLDIFCGPGGLSLGFALAGFDIVYSTDIDTDALETIKNNQSRIKRNNNDHIIKQNDISKIKSIEILREFRKKGYRVQGIIGGPPCRGFSSANTKTRSPDNPYNALYSDYIRLVKDLKPDFFMFENVIGLQSMSKGKIIDDIWKCLQKDLGYSMGKKILDSSNYGVPQTRKRLIIIGIKPEKIKSEFNGSIIFPDEANGTKITVKDAIFDLPKVDSGCGQDVYEYPIVEELANYARMMRFSKELNIESKFVINHSTTKNNKLVLERYKHIPQGGNWEDIPDDLLANYRNKNRCHSGIYKRLKEDEPSPTINNARKSMFIHPQQDRGLSVREAARLQSFPDWYVFYGSRDSQYQQVADAVPPLMARAIAENIKKMLIRTP